MEICKKKRNFAALFLFHCYFSTLKRPNMTILFTTRLPENGFHLPEHKLVIPETPYFSEEELMLRIAEAEILVSTFDFTVSSALLDKGKKLRLVASFGVGFNNIDIAYCRAHNILVTNTPLPVIEPTAEHCFALMHAIAHRTAELDRRLRMPDYDGIRFGVMNNLGYSLFGKTLGIVGMGRIGQAVARRAIAAGMRIIYYNRHQLPKAIEEQYEAHYTDMDTLLREADFISLHLPYTPQVHHLIDREALSKMKPTAILINTARGAHIDEAALAEALANQQIAGAALDVYEHEPHISEALLQLDNVVMSPHIGTGTIDGRLAMCKNVEENIRYFMQGENAKMNLVR